MTDERKTQLSIGVDTTPARSGFKDIEQGARDMAQTVSTAGKQAAGGLDGIGAGGNEAAAKLDRATSSMVQSVQRATAALQAGSKGSAQYFEALAGQRGVNQDVLRPYIEQLRQAEQGQRQLGVSAAQTAAAMRGVPAQLTDIITSLQGGQAPMTVLLQQGGQLKDMFGGIVPAARALGGAVLGLVNPFTIAAAAAGGLAVAYFKGAAEAEGFEQTLILTGRAAGVTTNQLMGMAASVSQVVGTQGAAAEVLTVLAGSGRVARDQLEGATEASIALAKATGQSATEIAKGFADIGRGPTEAILKLNEQYRFLTASTFEQIKALEDQGRKEEAAALAQRTYESALKDRAKGVTENLGLLETAWKSVGTVASKTWDAMLGIGRDSTIEDQIKSLESRRDRFQKLGGQTFGRSPQDVVNEYNLKIGQLRTQQLSENAAAASAGARQAQEERAIRWAQEREKYLGKAAKLEADITRIRNEGAAAGATASEIEQRIAFVREQARDKGAKAGESAVRAAEREAQALREKLLVEREALGVMLERGERTNQLNEGQREVIKIEAELRGSMDAKVRIQKEAALVQAKQLAMVLNEKEIIAEQIKTTQELIESRERQTADLERTVEKLREEEQAAGIAAAMNITLARAVDMVALARAREQLEAAKVGGADGRIIQALEAEIRAREQILDLATRKEIRDGAAKAAEDARKEWERASQEIERSITDALMRGFESGKGVAETLRDTVVNMFKTMVLRPVVQAIVQPVTGSILGTGPGAGSAGGGFGQVGNLLQTGQSLYGAFSGATAATLGGYASSIGSLTGISSLSSFGAGMQGATLASGLAGPTTAGASGAMGMGASAAAAMPYVAAALALYAVLDSVGAFKGATYHSGSAVGVNWDGSSTGRLGMGQTFMDQKVWGGYTEVDKRGGAVYGDPITQMGQSIVGALNDTFTTFGSNQRVSAFGAYGADGDDASEGTLKIYGNNGRVLAGTDRKKYSSNPSEGFKQYVADAGQIARDALIAADIPGWAKETLNALGKSPELSAVTQAVAQINAAQRTVVELGKSLAQFAGLTSDATGSLLKMFGGAEALQASVGAFVQTYFSEAEKISFSQKSMRDALSTVGLSLPTSKEAFRKLAESLNLNTDSGRKAYAVLMGIAPEFAATADAAKSMAEQVKASVDAMASGLIDEINRIKGLATTGASESVADLQARFAISTAQARAGDKSAIEDLPKLSQALLAAAEASAQSSLDVAVMRAQTLSSLEQTLAAVTALAAAKAVPGFATGGMFGGGWRLVGENGPEIEATGPARIFDSATTARILGGSDSGSAAVAAEVRALRQELAALRADQQVQAAQLAANTGRTVRILEAVTPDGNSFATTAG